MNDDHEPPMTHEQELPMTDEQEPQITDEREGRTIELEQTVRAEAEDVWEALTTAEGLKRWFPLDAEVEPGEGGRVWLSWGPGCEGAAPIHVWDPPSRFGWTESHGKDAEGRPIRVAVDFHVEGRGGSTVVRIVQSGFSASSDWDEMLDALEDGWRYFLFNLAFHFEAHDGADRALVWRRQPTELARHEVWRRLVGAGLVAPRAGTGRDVADREGTTTGPEGATGRAHGAVHLRRAHPAREVSAREAYHYAAVLPDLNESLWFVELEGRNVGFWLSIYDDDGIDVGALQEALDRRAAEVCGG